MSSCNDARSVHEASTEAVEEEEELSSQYMQPSSLGVMNPSVLAQIRYAQKYQWQQAAAPPQLASLQQPPAHPPPPQT